MYDFYDKDFFNGELQTWDFEQGPDGLMYLAQSSGLKEFDGADWRSVEGAGGVVFSLTKNPEGVIYVGKLNDLGYLKGNGSGKVVYQSLLEKVPEESRNFGRVSDVVVHGNDIWFVSKGQLMRLRDDQIDAFPVKNGGFHIAFDGDDLFFLQRGLGFFRLRNDSMEAVEAPAYPRQDELFCLTRREDGKILGGFMEGGFFTIDPKAGAAGKVEKWGCPDCPKVLKMRPYATDYLPDGGLAIATLKGG
ncbi:MAG: hypothetical protein AAF570_20495, partial [Bacteroidota bacterium]